MIHAALATLTQFEFIILNADELLAALNVMWQTCKGTGCLCCGVFPLLYALWRIFEQATINANSDHMMIVFLFENASCNSKPSSVHESRVDRGKLLETQQLIFWFVWSVTCWLRHW